MREGRSKEKESEEKIRKRKRGSREREKTKWEGGREYREKWGVGEKKDGREKGRKVGREQRR